MVVSEIYKSPRKVEEEIKNYRYGRFEMWLSMADNGEITRELAIAAFRDEDTVLLWVQQDDRETQK